MTAQVETPPTLVDVAVAECLRGELDVDVRRPTGLLPVRLTGLGTTATTALGSGLLGAALAMRRLEIASAVAATGVDDVVGPADWDLGLVLSPFKAEVGARLDRLSPSARDTGIVDTLLRTADGVLGVNTNSWALPAALAALLPGVTAPRILILGAGGTTRSALLGITRRWPAAEVFVSARRPGAVEQLRERFAVTAVAPAGSAEVRATVVINSTTWGETAGSESDAFGFPAAELLRPGGILFDLNNRRSALQEQALAAGCGVLSGTLMQRITHACRAAAVRSVLEATGDADQR
jgi:shikimate dehydrogenase